MLKKDITYTDFDGNEVTDTFYFHISRAELLTLELDPETSLKRRMEALRNTSNVRGIVETINDLIKLSIGRRSEDGKRFEKSSLLSDEFMESEAYSQFLFELLSDPKRCVDFVIGMMPTDVGNQIDSTQVLKEAYEDLGLNPDGTKHEAPVIMREKTLHELTEDELDSMPMEELQRRIKNHKGNVPKAVLIAAMRRT